MPWDPYFKGDQVKVRSESRDKRKLTTMFSHKHMIETVERFKWNNLPPELTTDLIERILYFRFKGAMFKYNDLFYFLPFTLNGTIDSYGRYESIAPVLFTGQFKKKNDPDTLFLPESATNKAFKVKYGKHQTPEDYQAVILNSSTLEISQDWIPMNELITPIIEQQVDILVLLNIDLINSAKVYTIVAKDADQKAALEAEFSNIDETIMNGQRAIVVTSTLELKELQGQNAAKDSAQYMQSFQSIDNVRKSIIGTDTGGAFLKKEHMTDNEVETNGNEGGAVIKNE